MTILIVGGTGQLGSAFSFVLNERKIQFESWGSKDLDIRSANRTLKLIGELKPSVIINTAAWINVESAEVDMAGAQAVNVDGVRNLVTAAKAAGSVFVQLSSDYVFSGEGLLPWKEDDAPNPINFYGKTKFAAETEVLLNYMDNSYVIRTAWLYSQWGKNFAKSIAKIALQSKGEVRVVDDQIGQPTAAIDLADQILDTLEKKLPFGIYHATNSGQTSRYEFAREVFNLVHAESSRIIPISSSESQDLVKRPLNSVLGHGAWSNTSLGAMRNWQIALSSAMPAIMSAVKVEG